MKTASTWKYGAVWGTISFVCSFLFMVPQTAFSSSGMVTDCLRIHYLEMKKETNGQISQGFQLTWPDHIHQSPEVFYSEFGMPSLYQAELKKDQFTIYADRYTRFRIVAVLQMAGTTSFLSAATDVMLFGKSDHLPTRLSASRDSIQFLSHLPAIDLVSPKTFYWHQTGQTFGFNISANGAPIQGKTGPLFVAVNDTVTTLPPDDHGIVFYTPSHDMRLRKEGYRAVRQDILFIDLPHIALTGKEGKGDGKLTYTLGVHRSRYAFRDIPWGFITASLGLFFFSGWIQLKRRQPWWKN